MDKMMKAVAVAAMVLVTATSAGAHSFTDVDIEACVGSAHVLPPGTLQPEGPDVSLGDGPPHQDIHDLLATRHCGSLR